MNNNLLTTLEPNQYFGELALLDSEPRSATVIAKEDCTLLTLTQKDFIEISLNRPVMLLSLCKTLSGHIRELNSKISK